MQTHCVVDGHDTRHDVDDPLRVDDDSVSQEIVVEKLDHAQIVQKADRLLHFVAVNPCVVRLLKNRNSS